MRTVFAPRDDDRNLNALRSQRFEGEVAVTRKSEENRAHQCHSRPLAVAILILRIHSCGRQKASFLVYHSIVASRPALRLTSGFQPKTFLIFDASAQCLSTCPGRSPTHAIRSFDFPVFSSTMLAIARTSVETSVPKLNVLPTTSLDGA